MPGFPSPREHGLFRAIALWIMSVAGHGRGRHHAATFMADPFEHVVLLMLENHSFDQMLGCMTDAYADLDGVRAGPPRVNRDAAGREYPQAPRTTLQVTPDPVHESKNVLAQLANHNGGFIEDYLGV